MTESAIKSVSLNGINNNTLFSVSSSIIQMQETMNSISEIYGSRSHLLDMIKAVQNVTHLCDFQIKSSLASFASTLNNYNSGTIKALSMVNPSVQFYINSGISEAIKNLNTQLQLLNYSDTIKKVLGQNNIGNIIQDYISINKTFEFNKLNYRDFQTEVEDINGTIIETPKTTIESSNTQLTIDDIENVVTKCLNESGIKSELMNLTNVVNNLVAFVKNLKDPLCKTILLGIIGSIIATILCTGFQNLKNTIYLKNNTNTIKTINKNVASLQIDKDMLKGYRFATIDTLIVWEDSNIKSKIIGNLHLGQVVRIKYKNKNWTLIEYKDDGDEMSNGWVFTRYISNFKY